MSKIDRKAIGTDGIGSMVYAFLAVTPMHDLMINIALPFALTAIFAILHMLYAGRRFLLFGGGTICTGLLLLSAVMYYKNVLFGFLPAAQKTSFIPCVGWLVAVNYAEFNRQDNEAITPNGKIDLPR